MDSINDIKQESLKLLKEAESLDNLEKLRVEILGKKGLVTSLMKKMRDLDKSERPIFGQKVNDLKVELETILKDRITKLKESEMIKRLREEKIDITLPGSQIKYGNRHPLTLMSDAILDLYTSMGYKVVKGPEVELDEYNFERANIPENHPAREMQDTFFVDVERLLRTHTTAIQTRVLEDQSDNLPIKVICPGKTYRRDDDDATHSHQFIQIEGLLIDENITMTDLKGTLEVLATHLFGEDQKIRLRPSYFQFTEPSVEVDVVCFNCKGDGCAVCKKSGWIELLGAGMVHPKVLEMAGIDSLRYSGFAFGLGVDRAVMLKYGVKDIRSLYTNDVRLLNMFDRFD